MLRFYNGSLSIKDIRNMRPIQFGMFCEEMNLLIRLEQEPEKMSVEDIKIKVNADPSINKVK